MADDPAWDALVEQGREAFRNGLTENACRFSRRARAAWITGWSEEFAKTEEAQINEQNSLRSAAQIAVDRNAPSHVIGELLARIVE